MRLARTRTAIAVAATGILLSAGVTSARAVDLVTMLWVPLYAQCKLVPGTLCLQAADGWTLQVTDLTVTEGGSDCIDLPKTHGDYVRAYDHLTGEALEPDLTGLMRTGDCATGTEVPFGEIVVEADDHFLEPIDASVSLGHHSYTGDVTYYDAGLGACGTFNSNSEMVAAIPGPLFDPYTPNGNPNNNSLCGRQETVTYQGKSVTVTIVDRCGGCPGNDIDLTPAAFQKIAPLSEGRVSGAWKFTT